MGGNKLFLSLRGERLLHRVLSRVAPWAEEVLVAVAPEDRSPLEELLVEREPPCPLRVVEDAHPGRGPLEGLAVALETISAPWAFVLGCDMPLVREGVVRILWGARRPGSDVICAELGGYLEPLHAFYSPSCLPFIREALAEDRLSLKSFYGQVQVSVAAEEVLARCPGYRESFRGANTPEEMERLLAAFLPAKGSCFLRGGASSFGSLPRAEGM